ncbi:MAG: glycine cleavage system protein GcvH [Candidatus Omnitrophica bacterium]|nr:glycine cleavage system protein GcvH [Candidatus Omnitrophota bacterium]
MDVNALKYLESHEWISVNGNTARVGISDHAQQEISDVVFVELPEVGKSVKQKESCLVVESVKAAFDIYAPASGKITQVNQALSDQPELINQSPFGDGWLFEMELSDPSELDQLMSADAYNAQHQ